MTARNMGSSWLTIALLLLLVSFPALTLSGQTPVKQLESHALAIEKQGNAEGALAAWQQAAAVKPKSALIQDHIGFLLAV